MKTRSIKELLQVVLEEGNLRFTEISYGLCGFTDLLTIDGKVDIDERNMIKNFINANRPPRGSVHYCESRKYDTYYWMPGSWWPRKAWLEDQIKSQ